MTLFVPICAALVSVADANSALRSAGFDMVVEAVDLRAHRGFLPVRLEGQLSGFEYYIDDAAEFETPAAFGACPQVVMLSLSLDHEVVAASAFAGVLAQSTRSGVLDAQEDQWLTPEEAFESARAMSVAVRRPFYHPGSS
jgi:hypothetical protein